MSLTKNFESQALVLNKLLKTYLFQITDQFFKLS